MKTRMNEWESVDEGVRDDKEHSNWLKTPTTVKFLIKDSCQIES